ncbi:MAG TPA: FecR family protein [Candidatus Acidoferrales bacterium]|nr:FecR family protein [Candidatus Acidoferrales bacterium]
MKRLLLLVLPAVLFAGQPRYARLGEFDGTVEVQLHPADPWSAAERNLTLRELAWLRTAASSRVEIELDEGSAWRMGADSQMEISDYALLSSAQRLTVLSLDRGVAYFTGEPLGKDTLMLVVPGAQVMLIRGARVRLEAGAGESRISVVEGVVRLSCPAAEIDLTEGQTVRVEPANAARFSLDREIPAMDLDRWSEERDKVLAAPPSQIHVAQHFGVADLDAAGEWLQTDIGAVWKPRVPEGWLPFQNGHWRWYDGLGYTWVSADAWGWLPYHFGRWTRKGDLGWVWSPASTGVFKPGDVYWLYGVQMAGWGPLAPGERWPGNTRPQQYLTANTTWAAFPQDATVIDPAGFNARPADPLAVAVFRLALPSPAFVSARLEASRPPLRVGSTRFTPVVPGTTFQDTNELPAVPAPPPVDAAPPSAGAPPAYPPDPGPAGPPMQTTYPVPVYTGIVVLNPPEHPDYSHPNPNRSSQTNPKPSTTPPTSQPPASSGQSLPRVVHPPAETRPNAGPRPAPVEHTKLDQPKRTQDSAPAPAPTPAPPSAKMESPRPNPAPPPARIDAPRPAPSAPPAPRVETPKAEAKADAKTDTSAKKQ